MADLKSVMVEHLRQLAHAHLGQAGEGRQGPGGLLGTLLRGVRGLARRLILGAERTPPVAAAPPQEPEDGAPAPRSPTRPLPGDDDEKTPVYVPPQPVRVVTFPPKPKPGTRPPLRDDETTLATPPPAPEPAPVPVPTPVIASAPEPVPAPAPAEPVVEGFFVARIAGEAEVSRHHLAEPSARGTPGIAEGPGALPTGYADDSLLLLPRDPHTLFALWDFSDASRQRALRGLTSPRAVLRLFTDPDRLLAVIDAPLEARGYYLHGLPAGQAYRLEAHFVGQDGRSHRIGPSSNRVVLPPQGPSADTSVRFLRVTPRTTQRLSTDTLLARPSTRRASAEAHEYITWRRVTLPGSADVQERVEARREPSGAPSREPEPVSLTGSVPAPEYLHVRRAEGSSEQTPGGPGSQGGSGAGGAGGFAEGWMGSAGPMGSSEQTPGGFRPPHAAPEAGHWYWSSGPGASSGPGGSSEQRPGGFPSGPGGGSSAAPGGPGGPGAWMGSSGPAGSSEQGAGGAGPRRDEGPWVWWYGPVEGAEAGGVPGQGAVSTQWVWSRGPAGSSQQWVWSFGPAGASEQSSLARPELPSSPVR